MSGKKPIYEPPWPDDSVIPTGSFCYARVPLRPGESPPSGADDGRTGRELAGRTWGRRVLCPYWQETDHGTVRCDYLGVEAVDDHPNWKKNRKDAIRFFGSAEALEAIEVSSVWLPDEIKICWVREEDAYDDEGVDPAP